MRFVEEIIVDRVLPTLRSMLAAELRERGLTQTTIADHLGVSQSAVSKYAAGDVTTEPRIAEHPAVRETVERVAADLANGDGDRVEALLEFEGLIRRLSAGGPIAAMHADAMPALRDRGIDAVHSADDALLDRERARSSVRRGLRILERAGVAGLLPAVGSNLVECTADATNVDDVVGVPGRLYAVKGRLQVPADPEFGVSEHVGRVLLAAREAGSDARGALNVRADDAVIAALEAADRSTVECTAPTAETDLATAVGDALGETPDADAVYHSGAHGVEPVCYLLATDAEAAAGIARDISGAG